MNYSLIKRYLVAVLLSVTLTDTMASIPLGAGRKTATGTVEMYGCLQANDYYIVNFAAYTASAIKSKMPVVPDCVNISETGETRISIDLLDRDLRNKRTSLQILGVNGELLNEKPFDIPKQGIISTQVNFPGPGHYRAVLLIEDHDLKQDSHETALKIPITVGLPSAEPAAKNTIVGMFALIGLMIFGLLIVVPKFLKPEPTI